RRLIVATLDRGGAEMEPDGRAVTPVAATELVDEIVELYAGIARARGITLVAECERGLPPLLVSPDPILRALGNLLGNALKCTPRGGHVVVRATASADAVAITVADTGPGVPSEALSKLFRGFWQ